MKILLIFAAVIMIIIACNRSNNVDEGLQRFNDSMKLEYKAELNYLNKKRSQIILLNTKTKCNFTQSFYLLDPIILDTDSLLYLTTALLHLNFNSMKKDTTCRSLYMHCAVYVFFSRKAFNADDWISSGNKNDWGGDNITVLTDKFVNYKKTD